VGSRRRAERLLAEGRPYDAMIEAGDDFEIGSRAYRDLGGEPVRERLARLEGRGAATREDYRALAEEALRGDEVGLRVSLVWELITKAGEDGTAWLTFGGDNHAWRYRETGRVRHVGAAMKYYGAIGARPAALALARVAVERFRREGGALHLTDALTGLCRDVHLSEAEVAAEDPVLQRWIPVQLRLEAAGPFVARHTWVREESTAYDEFLYGATGRSFDSFLEEARGKAPHGRFGRARLPRSAGDMLRTWGVAELIRVLREPPDDGA